MNQQEIGQTYREHGAQGADPLELVVMLYDVLLDDLRRAIEALHARDIEKRTAELQHALRILEQLQGSLDMEHGEEPARNLDRLYSMVRAKLIEAQWKASEDILRRQVELLTPIRDAWQQVRSQLNHVPPTDAESLGQENSPVRTPESQPQMEWRV